MLQQADEQTRSSVSATVRAAFEPNVFGAEVHFTAASWLVGAQAS